MSNQYSYSVPFTEAQLFHDYEILRMSQDEIAAKYKTTQHVVWRAMKKVGIHARKAAKRDQRGPKNAAWRGGRVLVGRKTRQRGERTAFGNGYYYVLLPDHPNANKAGYVAEHIMVLTSHLGRSLRKGELVHHVNLNKHDNSLANLALAHHKNHANWHNQLEEIAVGLLRDGRIQFDPTRGYYSS